MSIVVIMTSLVIAIVAGIPIAVALGMLAIGVMWWAAGPDLLIIFIQRFYTGMTSFSLLAIPFFILAGNLMNTGGMTTRIFNTALVIVGRVRGGLGHVNVIASMLFSGMSGSAVADAAGLGLVEVRAMRDAGYKPSYAAAITAASSTIGPVVPPSIPFVIYGSIANVSVGALFLAGVRPRHRHGARHDGRDRAVGAVEESSGAERTPESRRQPQDRRQRRPRPGHAGLRRGRAGFRLGDADRGCGAGRLLRRFHRPRGLSRTANKRPSRGALGVGVPGYSGDVHHGRRCALQLGPDSATGPERCGARHARHRVRSLGRFLLMINLILLVLGMFIEGIAVIGHHHADALAGGASSSGWTRFTSASSLF